MSRSIRSMAADSNYRLQGEIFAIACPRSPESMPGMKHLPVRSSGKARAAVGAAALPPATAAGWRIVIGGGLLVLISVVAGQPPWRCSLRRWSIVVGALAFL